MRLATDQALDEMKYTDLKKKIVSIVMGLVLYLFVMQEKEGDLTFTVPVRVGAQPPNHVLLTEVPEIQVTIAGRNRNLARLEDSGLSELVLRFDAPVTHRRLNASDFDLPAGLPSSTVPW